ncbi:P-II family nitrogen regulator [Nitrospira sp. Ecomares 2.1]
MSMSTNMTYLTDVAMITCVVQSGDADVIVKAARDAGATGVLVHQGRGIGIRERLGILGVAVDASKDIISVLVSFEQTDLVASHIFKAGQLDTPAKGFLYITPLEKVAMYIPEAVRELLRQKGSASERS